MRDVVTEHYRSLAGRYTDLLSYSPDFLRAHAQKMAEQLELREEHVLVDLGGGTGIFSLALLELVPLREPVICVDPYPEMLDQIPEEAHIRTVVDDALGFSRRSGAYDRILIKEAIHHIDEREELFANLHQRLRPGGILLLVHVPPDLEYPLFRAALERSRTWHADPDELVDLLEGSGFRVERDRLEYWHRLPKRDYFEMVEHCYMSVLSSFSDEERWAGLREMEERYADRDVLEFPDRFDYLAAHRD